MAVDPVTLEVFRYRLDAIAQEMQHTLLKSAFSIILKEGGDCSCSIFSPAGDIIAQATANPTHLAAFVPAVRCTLDAFPADTIVEGDVFILNDPYEGGTHIPDLIVMVPIFVGGTMVAIGCSLGHHQDMGGKVPGSMVTDATEIFQEGLMIPPMRLYAAGQINETLIRILTRNVRVPEQAYGDLMAQVAAGMTAAARIREVALREGVAGFRDLTVALLDYSEALTRAEIAAMPDGTYSFADYLDSDGVDQSRRLEIRVAVTISGSSLHFDFTGTSAQARGPANCAPFGVLASVYFVVRALTGSHIPSNSGCFRPITVFVPHGSLLEPERPAPVSIRYHTLKRVCDVLLGALAPALPGRIPAAPHGSDMTMSWGAIDPLGKRFVYMENTSGGTGGTWHSDGVDHLGCDLGNGRNIPAEAAELEFPVRIWTNRLRSNSGGAGTFRGGLGVERIIELLSGEAIVSHRSDRHLTPPWGLSGGHCGARWTTLVERRSGERELLPGRATFRLNAGDKVIGLTGGGGGYGDPLERPIELVLADVLDRKVSVALARSSYGVIITEGVVDVEATASERNAGTVVKALFDFGEIGLGPEEIDALYLHDLEDMQAPAGMPRLHRRTRDFRNVMSN